MRNQYKETLDEYDFTSQEWIATKSMDIDKGLRHHWMKITIMRMRFHEWIGTRSMDEMRNFQKFVNESIFRWI